MLFDDFAVGFLELAAIPGAGPGHGMEFQDGCRRLDNGFVLRMDPRKRGLISPHFLLVAVLKGRLAHHHRHFPLPIHGHAFDAVGGHGTFDQGMFPKLLEPLGGLPGIEFLLAAILRQIVQQPNGRRRNRRQLAAENFERFHLRSHFIPSPFVTNPASVSCHRLMKPGMQLCPRPSWV